MGKFYLKNEVQKLFGVAALVIFVLNNYVAAQCVGTNRNETNLTSSLSSPNDLTFKQVPNIAGSGVGANSRKIYTGITSGETYSFYLNTNNQTVNCSRIRFLNNSNSPIGGPINIARGNGVATDNFTQLTAPAGASRIEVTTSGTWTTTSTLLNYKKNLTTCSNTWYDSGGSGGNYGNNEVTSITFFPATAGNRVRVSFTQFSTENNYDGMMIYNGNSVGAPLISSGLGAGSNATTCPAGSWRGTGSPGTITSTAPDGSLTFVFKSDGSATSTGWTANVQCVPPPEYVAQIISADFGSSVWCAGDTRDVDITIKNNGTASWGPGVNIGLRWNGVWNDHYVRVPGNGLASGQTATFTLPITAKNATAGPNYGSDLAPGTYNLSVDVVKEGCFWFRTNSGPGGACGEAGPGNSEFISSPITITNTPPTGVSAGADVSICPNENISLTGSVNAISGSQTFGPFITSGRDANNITASGTISNLPSNAVITSINWDASIGNTCTSWYYYRLFVNGSQNGNNRCNLTNQILNSLNGQIANGNTLMIRAYDNDDWSDAITLSLTFTVNYEVIPSVSWSGGPIVSGGSTLTPTGNPTSTTTYTMTATNNGCSVSDDVTVNVNTSSTAPTSITGTSTICNGGSTTLTSNGGTNGTGAVDMWYEGSCNEAFTDEFGALNYSTVGSTVNSVDGVLNITSNTGDPMINMFGIGSFNPNIYKFINVRYRVLSGNAGNCEIFFNNPTYPVPTGPDRVAGALNSDGNWHILSLDMSSNAAWDDGNITGWRFDYVTNSGVNIEIDFISLSENRIIGEGSSINVSPTTNTTYSTAKKDECGTTSCVSKSITVVGQPQAPTTATKIPNVAGVCEGSSITLSGSASGGNAGVSCEIQYRYSTNGGSSWTTTGTTIPNFNSIANGNNIIQARRASCQSGCNSSEWSTVASWAVTAPPSAGTLSGNQVICASGSTTFNSTVNGGTWSSSNSNVATINASTGVISGVTAGTATMTYTVTGTGGCANATATRTVTVTAPPNTGTLSGTQAICASGSTSFNSTVNGGTWSSNNTNVATINASTGLISGVAAGTATMTYTVTGSGGCANATATRTVTVTAPPNAGTLSGTQAICASGSTTFTSTVNGGTWSSSNTNVATINASTGVISGVAAGTATMTYTVTGSGGCANATATRTVTVTAPPNAGTLSGTQAICASGSTTFTSTVNGGTWSSNNTNVATINASTGLISGVAAGTATMTYTVTGSGGCVNATATRTVTVTAPPNAGSLSGTQAICASGSTTFNSSVNGGTWSSSNTNVATINASTGLISGVTAGTATMTYTVTGLGGCANATATRTVSVTAPPNAGTLSGTQAICASGSTTFNSTINGGTWSSSNTNVATINASTGVISGVTAGTATMTYTVTGSGGCANATATRSVTIAAPPSAGTISGNNAICLGESIQFSITGNDNGTWQSTPSETSTISTNGNFTASQSGTYEVFYAVDNENACGVINSNSITVSVNAPSSEIAIDFSDQQLSVEVGDYIWSGQNDSIAQQLSNWYQKVAEDAYIIPTQFPSASDKVFVVPFEVASSCVIESNIPILGGNTTFEAKDFIVAENAIFKMSPNTVVNVTQNFIVRGTFDAGNGKVVFNGAQDQWIEGEGLAFYDLEVNKSAGELNLMNNIAVDHQVIMTAGDFKLQSKILDLGLTGELINERPESRIYCLCPEGQVRVERNITAQTEAFNPGNIGLFFTTKNKELGNTVITRRNEPGVVLNETTGIVAIDRIFDVTPSENNGNLQLTLEVEYFQPEVSNLQVEETFQVFRRGDGTNGQWEMKNVSERNPSSNNNGIGKVKLENWNQFSEVAIGEEDPAALPVEFLGMDVTCLNHAAGLTWETASELNCSHFEVQRSKDGATWETIETVTGQGTTQNTTTYNLEDPSFYRNQIGYYRLRQIDFDGVATIYGPYAVLCEGAPEEFKLYPNPTSINTTARFYWNNNSTVATLQLTDMTGKIISVLEKQVSKGINEVEINTSHLTKGVYRIIILHDGVTQYQGKLVKN